MGAWGEWILNNSEHRDLYKEPIHVIEFFCLFSILLSCLLSHYIKLGNSIHEQVECQCLKWYVTFCCRNSACDSLILSCSLFSILWTSHCSKIMSHSHMLMDTLFLFFSSNKWFPRSIHYAEQLIWTCFFNCSNFRVGIRLPTVEVRFQNLTVEADSYVGSRALPTLPNVALNIAESALGLCGISTAKRTKLTILKDVSGIIKPSRYHLEIFIIN